MSVSDRYKLTGIGFLFTMMFVCQCHWEEGEFKPIPMPKEWWAIVSGCFSYTVLALTGIGTQLKVPWMDHTRGILWLGILTYIGVSYYVDLPVEKVVIGTAGLFQGALYSANEK